jgi:hypothetical protein
MQSLISHFSAAQQWLAFVIFTVLPVAFHELVHWVYDWQVLVTGILAVVAARIWGRSVIRAARPTTKVGGRVKIEAAGAIPPVAVSEQPVPSATVHDRLFELREQIRSTLGRMPFGDAALGTARVAMLSKIASFSLSGVTDEARRLSPLRQEALLKELSAIAALRESDTCRTAWEALVRVSMAARDLMNSSAEPPSAKGVAGKGSRKNSSAQS